MIPSGLTIKPEPTLNAILLVMMHFIWIATTDGITGFTTSAIKLCVPRIFLGEEVELDSFVFFESLTDRNARGIAA